MLFSCMQVWSQVACSIHSYESIAHTHMHTPATCRDAWPEDPAKVAEIEADFDKSDPVHVGDRRQELVFIGIDVRAPTA